MLCIDVQHALRPLSALILRHLLGSISLLSLEFGLRGSASAAAKQTDT